MTQDPKEAARDVARYHQVPLSVFEAIVAAYEREQEPQLTGEERQELVKEMADARIRSALREYQQSFEANAEAALAEIEKRYRLVRKP